MEENENLSLKFLHLLVIDECKLQNRQYLKCKFFYTKEFLDWLLSTDCESSIKNILNQKLFVLSIQNFVPVFCYLRKNKLRKKRQTKCTIPLINTSKNTYKGKKGTCNPPLRKCVNFLIAHFNRECDQFFFQDWDLP